MRTRVTSLGRRGSQPGTYKLDHLLDGEAVRDHDRFGRAIAGCGEQFERAAAVGPGAVAQMAKRGERGIGEREHARVYPNARSGGGGRKQDKRVGGGGGWRAPSVRRERGATSRQKVLRYQRTA